MARFERSRERKSRRDSRDSYSKGRRSFEDRPRNRRDSNHYSRDKGVRTKVICSSCGDECEVPFKPTSSKPVYCDDCFAKKGKSSSGRRSNRDLDLINKKLDKIMIALKIK